MTEEALNAMSRADRQATMKLVVIKQKLGGTPKFGFDTAQAAEAPFVVDESVDEGALVGVGWAVVLMVFGGQLGEIVGGIGEE